MICSCCSQKKGAASSDATKDIKLLEELFRQKNIPNFRSEIWINAETLDWENGRLMLYNHTLKQSRPLMVFKVATRIKWAALLPQMLKRAVEVEGAK